MIKGLGKSLKEISPKFEADPDKIIVCLPPGENALREIFRS